MNRLNKEKQVQIVNLLVEGCSLRSVSRLTGCSINTVSKLMVDVGRVCLDYHYSTVKGLKSKRVQADEIWSFVYSKEKTTTPEIRESKPCAGSAWTWVAMDADSKLVISYLVGDRGDDCAEHFLMDLQSRLNNRVQLSTDGYRGYTNAVELNFGAAVDYGQVVKIYSKGKDGKGKREQYVGCEKRIINGFPEEKYISTSYIERQNLTIRMSNRRFGRKTNAFSKKIENHILALSLHYFYYNFCRKHQTLKATPAMIAGLTSAPLKISDLIDMMNMYQMAA